MKHWVTLEDMNRLERVALDLDGRIKTLEAELQQAREDGRASDELLGDSEAMRIALRTELQQVKAERDRLDRVVDELIEDVRAAEQALIANTNRLEAERDAALKLVDDTLVALGGDPSREIDA